MVGIDDLKSIVREIEERLHHVVSEDMLRTRLTRDLDRAHLYLKAVRTGYADLVPERLSLDLVRRYKSSQQSELHD